VEIAADLDRMKTDPESMRSDTIAAGDGLVDPAIRAHLAEQAPAVWHDSRYGRSRVLMQ